MSDATAKLAELAELEAKAKALREEVTPTVTERMNQITKEINALAAEGVKLADEAKIEFSLAGLDFLPYGSGGLSYNPVRSQWDDEGWSSSSMSC